ncbi:MAG: alpha/beta hydrolase [Candidatus Bathyarchaeota archaeon]|nr:alpha/beta hydrolase [Candidatus Termiticorpusculum sp.]
MSSSQTITLPDGRSLGYATIGRGEPVMYFHGTASSRLEVYLLKHLAMKEKIQLIAIDRPGYGLSTYKPRKNIQDLNNDLNYLANHLGIEKFSVLGWSGGGVFALAYMTCCPQRVICGVIAGTPDLPFEASTAHNNIPLAKYVMKLPFLGTIAMHNMRRQVLKADSPEAFLHSNQGRQTLHTCSRHDLTFFSNPTWMGLMHQSMTEAFRQNNSIKVILEEHKLFLKPWNLPFKNISNKLWIWQGTEDKTCPIKNAYSIAHKIKESNLEIFPQQGHCVIFDNTEKLAERLKNV